MIERVASIFLLNSVICFQFYLANESVKQSDRASNSYPPLVSHKYFIESKVIKEFHIC